MSRHLQHPTNLPLPSSLFMQVQYELLLDNNANTEASPFPLFDKHIREPNWDFIIDYFVLNYPHFTKIEGQKQYEILSQVFHDIAEDIQRSPIANAEDLTTTTLIHKAAAIIESLYDEKEMPFGTETTAFPELKPASLTEEALTQFQKCYGQLFSRHQAEILTMLCKKYSQTNKADCEDALSEAGIIVWRRLLRQEIEDKTNLVGYIYTVAKRKYIEKQNKNKTQTELNHNIADETTDPLENEVYFKQLNNAMGKMKEKYYKCYVLLNFYSKGGKVTNFPMFDGIKPKNKQHKECLERLKDYFFGNNQ